MFELDRMPKADDHGFFCHPDVPDHESLADLRAELERAGWDMAHDTAGDDCYQDDSCEYDREKLLAWKPVPPGPDWLLVSVYDSEDGPYALFVRERQQVVESDPANTGAVSAAAKSLAALVVEWIDGGNRLGTDWRPGLAGVIDRRLTRLASRTAQTTPTELPPGAKLAATLEKIVHDMVVANQAAWIEWRHGRGAEAAMQWIENGLSGPGHIPDARAPYGTEAQAFFDANRAEPFPLCYCDRPSNQLWMGHGACSDAHMAETKKRNAHLFAQKPESKP